MKIMQLLSILAVASRSARAFVPTTARTFGVVGNTVTFMSDSGDVSKGTVKWCVRLYVLCV